MQQMGLQARLMSQALRKMSGNASKAGCTLIFLNQIRYKVSPFISIQIRFHFLFFFFSWLTICCCTWFGKIGVYYGNPEVTSGGIALKFFASLRLEIRPTGKIKSVSTSPTRPTLIAAYRHNHSHLMTYGHCYSGKRWWRYWSQSSCKGAKKQST